MMFCSRFCFVSSLCSLAVANMQYSLCGRLPSLRVAPFRLFVVQALLVDSDHFCLLRLALLLQIQRKRYSDNGGGSGYQNERLHYQPVLQFL